MPLVLAIEPDHRQATILKRIVREHVHAEFVLVDSRDAAVSSIGSRIPDVILVTALLSPRDEDELVTYLRTLKGAEHLQTYTIPQLASAGSDGEQKAGGGLFGKFRKKKDDQTINGCDPELFGQEILTFLERASEGKHESAATLQQRAARQELVARAEASAPSADVKKEFGLSAPQPEPQVAADSAWADPFAWRPASERTASSAAPPAAPSMVTKVPLAVVAENQEAQAEQDEAEERNRADAATRAKQEEEARQRQKDEKRRAERAEEERKRTDAEAAAKRKREEEERQRLEVEAAARRKREEEERKRLEAESAARRKREEEERKRREQEERRRLEAEAAARRQREEEARKRFEAEAAARRKREEEERKRREEEERRRREEEERKRRAEEERKRVEAEAAARRKREEEERRRREEEERKRRDEEERKRREEEERKRLEAEAAARRKREEEERKRREEEERRRIEAELAARRKREEEERRRREEEEARRREEEARRQEEEDRRREDEERQRRIAAAEANADPFREFRAEHDEPKGVLRYIPVSDWARVERRKRAADEIAVQDEFLDLLSGLRIPQQVAVISYPRGCRIRRVRVRSVEDSDAPEPPPEGKKPVILSRKALQQSRQRAADR